MKAPPNPNDIRLACLQIQASWTRRQEWSHAGKPSRRWVPPVVGVRDMAAAVNEETEDERDER